ncbi:Kelch repeat-containing protein [Candidatus Frankia nodulisporulans]|uniref:Kelch repeat-containing protein n=1 Tax=Candidatus Frankia nodulisporulans TaxID=2060052 RepID=UPI0021F09451|nr:kelch repeat-containing protein [Candidatus Frankia nodulisporulans]
MGSVAVLDPKSGAWSDAADLPTPRTDLAAVTGADGRIYAIGGQDADGPTDTVEVYQPASDSWSDATSLPAPMDQPRAARGGDGRIYALDGTTLAIYDPAANAWSTAPAPPSALDAPIVVALSDGRILAAGGTIDGTSAPRVVSTTYVYTPGTDGGSGSWAQVAGLPTPVTRAAGATGPDGRVYVVGGRGSDNAVTDTVQIYSPDRDSWDSGTPGEASDRADAAATTGGDGHIYVLGGTSGSDQPEATVATLSD